MQLTSVLHEINNQVIIGTGIIILKINKGIWLIAMDTQSTITSKYLVALKKIRIIPKTIFYFFLVIVSVEYLIGLLTSQCFQILLTLRMFPVWDIVVGIFARKALLNSGRVLSTLSC